MGANTREEVEREQENPRAFAFFDLLLRMALYSCLLGEEIDLIGFTSPVACMGAICAFSSWKEMGRVAKAAKIAFALANRT